MQVTFCNFILGVNRRDVYLTVNGEPGRFPVTLSCAIQAFEYFILSYEMFKCFTVGRVFRLL